jgi:hypothetical protein
MGRSVKVGQGEELKNMNYLTPPLGTIIAKRPSR